MKMLLRGGNVYSGGAFRRADVLLEDGRVVAVGDVSDAGAEAVDVTGKHVLPGLIDVHVHFREPGFSYKETIASGSRAAARGGYTTVCTMPNLNPAPDTAEQLEVQLGMIRNEAVVKVVPYGTITMRQSGGGALSDMEAMRDGVVGFSDDGRGVQEDAVMEAAMREAARLGRPVVAHCEVNDLLHGGYIHDGEYARLHGHKGICSESEWRQVARDIELVRRTGCRYHVCHVSTKESVELVRRAKAEGLPVSCETAPHYLVLTDMDLQEDGRFKMNPPIRSAEDRAALLDGLLDGTIEVIATDHAPHSAAEKAKGLAGSAFGIVGLETSFPVLYTRLVLEGVLPLEKLVELMSVRPGRLFGLGGTIEPGAPADIAVFDLGARYRIESADFLSQGHATPFDGWEVQGRNVLTLAEGRPVYRDASFGGSGIVA
ncbi:MAG TPA: dihydroorotase [Candidatus Tidjanibacter gallistercoris]|nr:dihydroorotase [Candidatus Tidjanibacter gallistercoris]